MRTAAWRGWRWRSARCCSSNSACSRRVRWQDATTRRSAHPAGVFGMTKEMIVSSNDHETMVAILEEDQLVELFIERERNRGVVGNVYKGRVSKVLPGMQS